MSNGLQLQEELLLLALHDEKGTNSTQMLHYGLAGAVLAELLLLERIELPQERKRMWVQVRSNAAVGNDAADAALTKIDDAKRRGDLKSWVSRVAGIRHLRRRIADGLCRQGVLRQAEGKLMWVFSRTTYPETNPQPERELRARLDAAIFSDAADVAPRTTIAISLAQSSGVLASLYPSKQLKPRLARIEQIVQGELAGQAVGATVQAVQTAVLVAAILPAILVPTMVHH